MCHPHPVAGQIDSLEDTAFGAAAYGADRQLMLHLLTRALLDLDDPETVDELRSYLNHRAPAVTAARAELLAELQRSVPVRDAEVHQLVAGPVGGRAR